MTQSVAYKSAVALLKDKRLSEALELMLREAVKRNHSAWIAEVELTRDNYSRLLQYFQSGTSDPSRQDQLDALFAKAWDLAERLNDQHQLPEDVALSDAMTLQMISGYLHSPLEGEDRDKALGRLFVRLRDCAPLTREVRRAIHQLILDEQLPEFERATLLSGVTLNLLQWFDAGMLEQFYTYSLDDQPTQIRMQALLSLVLCAMRYDVRIQHEPRLRELYRLLAETEQDALAAIQVTLPYCKDSVGFRKRLTNVVKVELGKLRVGQQAMPFQEFLSIFQDGIDYDYDFFKMQCQRPFFADPDNEHHWLMPFSLEQYKLQEIVSGCPEARPFLTMMMSSMSQTHSSKYAHTMALAKSFPSLIPQITAQLKDTPIKLEDLAPLDAFTTLRLYMHDLFRYLTLTAKGKQIANPLVLDADFAQYACLREETEDVEWLAKICQTLYTRSRWKELFPRLVRLTRKQVTPDLLLQLATTAEHCGEYYTAQEALCRYQALFTFEESHYLRLARDYEATRSFVAEENALHQALKLWPDSEQLLLQMARCLNRQLRPSEALAALHHAEFLPDKQLEPQTHYQLALAYVMLRQADNAEEHIAPLLLQEDCPAEYWKLSTLIAMMCNQAGLATQRYRRLVEISDKATAIRDVLHLSHEVGLDESHLALLTLIHDTL